MDFYPAELATPPLALVALLGCPDLHAIVGEFLRAAQKPPINSLGIGEPAMAARLFGEEPMTSCPSILLYFYEALLLTPWVCQASRDDLSCDDQLGEVQTNSVLPCRGQESFHHCAQRSLKHTEGATHSSPLTDSSNACLAAF